VLEFDNTSSGIKFLKSVAVNVDWHVS